MNSKILSQEEIIKIVNLLKKTGHKIVVVNGSFDIMHSGHVNFLEKSKKQGNILVVLVNSDNSIKKYKGPNRPIINERERTEMVAALSCVNYVSLFDDFNPINLIAKIKPTVYCNGSDWGKYCVEKETVESNGGKVFIIKREKNTPTTSGIISKILKIYSKPKIRAVFIDRDGTINNNKDGYIHKIEDFEYLPGVISGLRKLSKTDYKIIIITNQSGIGRGYYKQADYDKLMRLVIKDLSKHGVRIDGVYFCPHIPRDNCFCRKPKTGMLISAVNDFAISLNDSWVLGDSDCDVILGRNANAKTIKIGKSSKEKIRPNYFVNNFTEAMKKILEK